MIADLTCIKIYLCRVAAGGYPPAVLMDPDVTQEFHPLNK